MLHLGTIEHGKNQFILLPYAPYGDLEVFLHCGQKPNGKRQYDFNQRFKQASKEDMTLALLSQCQALAHALAWLHNGIAIEDGSSEIFCVHMDLKPSNILIETGGNSTIGKWKIADFGISVLKDDKDRHGAEFVSVGDYTSILTINTRPKRQEGTYQAPEVRISEADINRPVQLTADDQKGIGRKSDIWSYGCILSEVLAFALGKDGLVREFQAKRSVNGNDYFYDEVVDKRRSQHLTVSGSNTPAKEFCVRPSVLEWLDNISREVASPLQWVDCCAETIKKILVVNTDQRPDSTRLVKLINHIKQHTTASKANSEIPCPMLKNNDGGPEPTEAAAQVGLGLGYIPVRLPPREHVPSALTGGKLPQANHPLPTPLIVRSSTLGQEKILDHGPHPGDPLSPSTSVLSSPDSISQPADSVLSAVASETISSTISQPTSPTDNTSAQSPGSGFPGYQRPAVLHGLILNAEIRRQKPLTCVVPFLGWTNAPLKTPTAVAISHYNEITTAAYLVKDTISLYTIDSQKVSTSPQREFALPSSNGWSGIALAGDYFAAWGHVPKVGRLVSITFFVAYSKDLIFVIRFIYAIPENHPSQSSCLKDKDSMPSRR
jgi:serine/threonine protein kinase